MSLYRFDSDQTMYSCIFRNSLTVQVKAWFWEMWDSGENPQEVEKALSKKGLFR